MCLRNPTRFPETAAAARRQEPKLVDLSRSQNVTRLLKSSDAAFYLFRCDWNAHGDYRVKKPRAEGVLNLPSRGSLP